MGTFGEWLRQERDRLKLTREQFAGRVGCSVALLRKIEDSERRPSAQIAELMANSLGIPPAEHATFVKVARGELSVGRLPSLAQPGTGVAAAPASTTPRINLPVLPTPLIGRQREVEELDQLLRDPACRLLTLVGPGGIGKTRLAIEAASRLQDDYADGVYFVPLAPVNSARFIVPVIADVTGFTFESASGADPKTQLFSYLKEKHVLLLTDNLEHLLIELGVEPGIEVLAELLAHAPRVKLLATSRESLGLQGEWVFEVQGLPVPESEQAEHGVRDTSVELFLQRARRAHVGFNATPADYPAIVRICRLVDGMPLGIELAAAWVRTLSCDEIAHEIERGLDFLSATASARDLPARHRSMRAVFDHSWKLLTPEEQAVLLRLSVFLGGFRREAAEAVTGATLPTLSALVTKSLIRRSGDGRYDLHELIRQFTAEHLAQRPEEQAATQARHGRYYLTFFSQADERLRSAAQREVLAELTTEIDNFRAAWEWAVTQGEFALIEPTLRTFAMFSDMRGWLQEGLDTLGRAITALGAAGALEPAHGQLPPDRTNQVTLGHLLVARALLASRRGQYEQAQAMLERSLDILRPLNEPRVLVEAVTFLGMAMEATGSYAKAVEFYSEGLETATAIGDRWFAALCLTLLSDEAVIVQGVVKPERALEQLRSVVADWRAIGDPRLTAIGLSTLSFSALRQERYDEARAAVEESIALSTSIGDRWALGFGYRGLGLIAQARGEHRQAVDMLRKSQGLFNDLGARQDVARVLAEMSRSIFVLGNDAEAGRIWRESLRMGIETRGTFIALEALVGIASLRAKRGELEPALVLLLIVLRHPASTQETRLRAAQLRSALEAQLTSQQVEAAQARAQATTFEAAVDEVLKLTELAWQEHGPAQHG
jgi:predicted ATPase/transcriptional regulator with XRE-family HTH domain